MTTRSLDGLWTFRLHGKPRGAAPRDARLKRWLPAPMPGTIHLALQKAGVIADPFDGRNELAVQWIDEQDWELRRVIEASAEDCRRARQELVFEGIDTAATILLNGRRVGRSENMFRRVVCDVRGALRPGRNELLVVIESPTAFAKRQSDAAPKGMIPENDFVWQTGERRPTWRTGIRKVQCHFGWDWGTYLATSGVWQPCRLECADTPRIAYVQAAQQHIGPVGAPRRVELTLTVRMESTVATEGSVVAILMGGEMPKEDRRERAVISAVTDVRVHRGETVATITLQVERPILWWPAGQGEQYLYFLSVHFVGDDGKRSHEVLQRIGLRTCEVVTTADKTSDGKPAQSFLFRVNGRDVYAKGANWIPADQFVERCTPAVTRHLLASMREANMNMVRVWGGGWYEQESFYDACDELGLLVWQDFMMACGYYPETPAFLRELRAEAIHQVRRLSSRPCIALWCGDNENNTGVAHWWKKEGTPESRLKRYRRIIGTLAEVCAGEDASRRFWPSSPSNGEIDLDPDSPNRGDVHYWAVWHGRQPFSNYHTVKPRFASEFGFQSFPEPRTTAAVVPREELNPSSRTMEHHQRSNDGNLLITNTMAREMRIPKDFDAFCWVSQINQAMAIRTAVEHWRRLKPWCMGTIYWQINDLWPVASWSSIDWHGRWKVLHHAAQRFYAPLLASTTHADGKLAVWATSDLHRPLALDGWLDVIAWDGRPVARERVRGSLDAGGSRALATFDLADLLGGRAETHQVCCFVTLAGGDARAENFATLVPWKWTELRAPRLRTRLAAGRSGVELTVRAENPVPFFHAELEGLEGHFAGDWQVMRPGRDYRLTWVPHSERGARMPSATEAKRRLRTLSLWDTFAH
jgi:beta-mannosidase